MAATISSMGAVLLGAAAPLSAARTSSASGPSSGGTSSGGSSTAAGWVVNDQVSLSSEALAAAAAPEVPVRKSFAEVTDDARASLNQTYEQMKASGAPFDPIHAHQEDVDKVFGQLDRRTLFAIASNSGGQFTKDEQDIAQSVMGRQQGQAMGLYDPMGTDPSREYSPGFAAGIRFLDSVSDEEKASADWQVQRASLQWSYEITFPEEHPGKTPENFNSGDSVVNLLVATLHSMENGTFQAISSGHYVQNLDELRDAPAFSSPDRAAQLDQAIAQFHAVQGLGGTGDTVA